MQPTCEERISQELSDRAEQLADIWKIIDGDEPDSGDDAYQELDSLALSIEPERSYRIVLSTGGPHDEIVATYRERELVRLEYVFSDWFDGARRTITENDPAYGPLSRYADYMTEAWGDE